MNTRAVSSTATTNHRTCAELMGPLRAYEMHALIEAATGERCPRESGHGVG